jgi:hyperosmotically inducible protein
MAVGGRTLCGSLGNPTGADDSELVIGFLMRSGCQLRVEVKDLTHESSGCGTLWRIGGWRMAMRRGIVGAMLGIFLMGGGWAGTARAQDKKSTEPASHQNLIKEVRHQLLLLPYYSVFDNLSFRIDRDTVTLEGQVVRPTLRSDAESAVKSIEGVSAVVNNIEVLPVSPMDDSVRRAVYRALYGDSVLSKYAYSSVASIHIIVKNGNVTLEGVVDDESDKNLANLRANAVPNVFSVKNNLTVAGGSK